MKIRGDGPGPLGPFEPRGSSRTQSARTGSPFEAETAASSARFTPPPGASRADLDNPAKMGEILRASAKSMLDASPLGAAIPEGRRAELETHLAQDPMMRDLLTRLLEGCLR